jgi:hypothetical protein
MHRTFVWGAVLSGAFLLEGTAAAQTVPAGWKTVTDMRKVCQIAVPADWTADSLIKSFVTSPDKKANAVVHGLRAGSDFAGVVASAKLMLPPAKTFEESASKIWYEETPKPGTTERGWYVAVGGAQACNAEIKFEGAAFEETAKKIAASLGPAAK